MIQKIQIHNVATYSAPESMQPLAINFCYGSNGSGKTTISNILGQYIPSPKSDIIRSNSIETKTLVYNKKFIQENFKNSNEIKGIFTLGEEQIDIEENIRQLSETLKDKEKKLLGYQNKANETSINLKSEKNNFDDICWHFLKNDIKDFKEFLIGFMKSKEKFSQKCLDEYERYYDYLDTLSIDYNILKEKYSLVTSKTSITYELIDYIDLIEVDKYNTSDLLTKVITGSNETPFSTFIDFLNNSDWVKQGINFIDKSEHTCPFCQQPLSNDILENLRSFFDRSYEIELNKLKNLYSEYQKLTSKINSYIEVIIKKEFNFTAHAQLKVFFERLKTLIELNNEKLKYKLNNPSQKVKIESISPLLQDINNVFRDYNERIDSNNRIVNNRQQEFDSYKELFWKYTILNLKDKIQTYKKKSNGLNKAFTHINSIILEIKEEINKLDSKIKTLEASTTNIKSTIQFINKTLRSFDFKGFYIKENSKGTYKLVRDDETSVMDSLSEGEYNFITFLYFYYLVYGSHEKTGITSSKIIVIDDPVSSLDNHVLFIVSNLVKKIRDDCRENKNGIIQLFIFTHNTYFHKEITFLGSRDHYGKNEVFFGILNKKDNQTILTPYDKNPINSSYQLMWKELNSPNISHTTCYNTMRRILEYYFNIIGANNYEKLINQFEGNEKYVCRTLISIINDNSHDITDDLFYDFNKDNIETHKKIFKLIFEKLGHSQHYDMMSQIE